MTLQRSYSVDKAVVLPIASLMAEMVSSKSHLSKTLALVPSPAAGAFSLSVTRELQQAEDHRARMMAWRPDASENFANHLN